MRGMRQRVITLVGFIIGIAAWLLMLYYAAWAASLAP